MRVKSTRVVNRNVKCYKDTEYKANISGTQSAFRYSPTLKSIKHNQ